nr:hypothetical protein [Gammaproteobacteria bacterium]
FENAVNQAALRAQPGLMAMLKNHSKSDYEVIRKAAEDALAYLNDQSHAVTGAGMFAAKGKHKRLATEDPAKAPDAKKPNKGG